MFLFSIVPIGLRGALGDESNDEVHKLENQIKQLEGFYTSKLLGYDFDADLSAPGIQKLQIEGLDLSNMDAVNNELEKERNQEIDLIQKIGFTLDEDPNNRLLEIQAKIRVAGQRLENLNGLKNALSLGNANPNTAGIQVVSGLNTPLNPNGSKDINVVMEQIKVTEAYEKMLNDAKDFWNKILDAQNNNGSGGYNRLLEFEGLLKHLENGGNGNQYDIDQNASGIQLMQGVTNLNDKNEIKDKIVKLKTELLDKVPAIKNDAWFKSFINGSGDSLAKMDGETQTLQKKIDDLNQAFISIISGELSEVNIGGVLYKDISGIKDQIFKTTSYMQDLSSYKSFLNQIKSTSSSDIDKTVEDAKKNILLEAEKSSQAEKVTSAMYRTMELEGLLTSLNTARQASYSVDGVDNSDADAVSQALDEAKTNETRLREESGLTSQSDSLFNLTFARKMNELVGGRINDLQSVEQYLTQVSQKFYSITKSLGSAAPGSFSFEDPTLVAVRMELQRVEEYKKGTDEIQAYWNKIIGDSNKQTETPQTKPKTTTTQDIAKTLAASNERKISSLKEIFDFLSDSNSVESLQSREVSIRQEIESQIKKLNGLINSSPTFTSDKQKTFDMIGELRSVLSSIIQQKSYSRLMGQIGNSVKETLSRELINQGIYSGYS